MSKSFLMFFACIISSFSSASFVSDSEFWYLHQYTRQAGRRFERKTNKFWEFQQQSKGWVEIEQPFDLVSCVDGNCTRVCSIDQSISRTEDNLGLEISVSTPRKDSKKTNSVKAGAEENAKTILPFRKRVSLTKMSDTSIWITGPSGSIYERFWNGLQWVIAPHDLPVGAGYAVAVFVVNQTTILALAESGNLYQMKLNENSQPVWVEFTPVLDHSTSKEAEQTSFGQVTSGVISDDRERLYFCSKNRSLLELVETEPPRWISHGRPPGANVEAIVVDASSARPEIIFTVSSAGDLYEYDKSSRPSWKKHIQKEGSAEGLSLAPTKGCTFQGLNGANSVSLFLLTRGGNLVERQFRQRKWKWIHHGSPKDHVLTSITCAAASHGGFNVNLNAMFLTTAVGCVFEYQIPLPRRSGASQDQQFLGQWVNHDHPPHAKVARKIAGLQLQVGRFIFPLDDGRLSELHLPGTGGDSSAPNHLVNNARRKVSHKYVWSIVEAPETEGWNAEYCIEEHGPTNCFSGTKDENNEQDIRRLSSRRRLGNNAQETYLSLDAPDSRSNKISEYDISLSHHWITKHFRLRLMHEGKSFFLITDDGQTFEYLNADNMWFWLRHEHSTAIRGVVGNYNGSLFLVDDNGSLFIRERSNNELGWINCTALKKGRQIIGGPPWDAYPGNGRKVTATDALYFVSTSGKLLQLTVALRRFKWKDCRNPPNTKIACVADQQMLRDNIVFVVGRNGRLYQYNQVTELWHEHYQSKHLVLSQFPGTAMRPASLSLKGSLFMVLENGRLVEYHWDTVDGGWHWVEHGTPNGNVTLVGSPGPSFGGDQLFLIGSDGNVYLRYLEQASWKWENCGFPNDPPNVDELVKQNVKEHRNEESCLNEDLEKSFQMLAEDLLTMDKICDPKVDSTRPISFADTSVIFELRDGRLAELQQTGEKNWVWTRTIGTPTSLCLANYWAALAS